MTSAPASPAPAVRETLFAVLAVVGGSALAYHNTFAVPFVFDDNSSIRDNPTIRSLLTAWQPPRSGGLTVSGRPLLNFTLALNYAVSGTAVWSYHLLNLLIHAAAGCTLFGVVRRTFARPVLAERFGRDAGLLALAVALLWTLHPLQTESVTYVVQRAEALVGLMYLLTLYAFIRASEPGAAKIWAVLAFGACLLGMTAKEVMVTAPVMVALYDRIFVAGSWRELWARRSRLHLALAATWLLLAFLVISTDNRGGTAGLGGRVSVWAYALTQIGAVVQYLRLALWPRPLVFDYGMGLAGGWGDVWWQALVLFPLIATSLWAAARGRVAGYCGVFFFGVLAPSSSFVPVMTQTMNEHRVYLALAAVMALVVAGLYAAWGRKSFAVFAVLAVALTVATIRRNYDYRTELALWEDTAIKRPTSVRALLSLGAIHQAAGQRDEALAILQEAVRVAPQSAEAHNNLGNAWMNLGQSADAEKCFREALQLQPDNPYALSNLADALLQLGRAPEAIGRLEAALRLKPDFIRPRRNLASTLVQTGRLAEAAVQYAELLRQAPNDAETRSNYATVLMNLGRTAEAIDQLAAVVQLQPDVAELHNNLGAALAQAGRLAEALREFREAVRLKPDYEKARENADRATRALGGG